MYRQQRNYENVNRAIYRGVPPYGIPQLKAVQCKVDNWIGFNYMRTCEEPEIHGIHFFVDDYQFNRVWAQPDTYTERLKQFQAVCAPDFSTYTDFPKALQIYNHYRKHWLGKYWQTQGVMVIPTISWSDYDSYEWCFDGEPLHSMVAVSSVGTQANNKSKEYFLSGYKEMMRRLKPTAVIMYGTVPEECTGNIIPVKAFQAQTGRMRDPAETMSHAKTGTIDLVRTDNLKLSGRITQFVRQNTRKR